MPHATRGGFGLGLRPPFYQAAAVGEVAVDWFEVISENFMVDGGNPLRILDAVADRYPLALHGVSMNLGGTDPLDRDYLNRLKGLVERVNPVRVSDHLCWTRHGGHHLHDLLPLPYTEESVKHVAERIGIVQDYLQRRILIENVSSYAEFTENSINESAFLSTVAKTADCYILLDVNNIVVSAHNHGFDAESYLQNIPIERVQQIHLAGHTVQEPLLIDTHDHPIADPVWELYRQTIHRLGEVPTMIERDDNIPPLTELLLELNEARQISQRALVA
ncbi:MAG TPA: DUF692 domain-containing protein [Gammaproteobacteria bacterium]|nr:DUF692 domain-containing protein [Gammaproteobacteria bacterium]